MKKVDIFHNLGVKFAQYVDKTYQLFCVQSPTDHKASNKYLAMVLNKEEQKTGTREQAVGKC